MGKVGIVGWGVYIPRFRISTKEIARVWGDDPLRIKDLYWVEERSVGGPDEDAVTMAVEASRNALRRAGIDPRELGSVFVGTESKPYAVKPIASILIEALGMRKQSFAVDMEFACKAGSDAIVNAMGLVKSGLIKYGLAVGVDHSHGEPGEHLDYTVSGGAAAYVIGSDGIVAEIEHVYAYNSDTPDFWRRDGIPYAVHGESFTGEPAYFRHIVNAAKALMEATGLKPSDFDYAVFHQPNARFPVRVAQMLGIPLDKVKLGIVVDRIGNTYNGAVLIGLANILENAKPGSRILMVSFGSGAGSNAFSLITTDLLPEKVGRARTVSYYLENKAYIDYALYLRFRNLIKVIQ
ncbi:hydroxymethylglutaryl-CoA synthase [Vulcanisaeta distributa]|uniref:Hydroxymethylglutaryl-CoA synthase n=1 Tax=Vulcanisaeta distributa (strain DSM 14429 / JCM 11212 / NBRC 100878 / IC-017) TaxID=572478 RepID=E1QP18_VULDI|nr:hydroxymethylglutaryl-CoA synthase [Vulcanisaeta distributa]ADN51383.1 hydroxymethylglutaryl-CoA synthase [Vulcanisaeta distributa DSM 14429]